MNEGLQQFKEMFQKYCQQEIQKGHCADDSCALCPINTAYDEIFCRFAGNSDESRSDNA